jgi:predicted O-methyltransferase YrrM
MSLKSLRNRLLQSRHRRLALEQLRALEVQLGAPQTRLAVPFLFRGHGLYKSIRPMQSQFEIAELYHTIFARQPKVVLEIGTCHGGTLYLWCQAADPQATIISIDLPEGEFGGGYPAVRTELYRAFAVPGQQLHFLRADSHSSDTATRVQQLLGGQAIDFLFIDGDHTYAGVKRDFELYSPLVAKDGLIALHDIVSRADEPRIEVWKFWQELKQRQPAAKEWLDTTATGRRIGIGLLHAPA